jgi:alcohol dehydrogenase, propanol-preferring
VVIPGSGGGLGHLALQMGFRGMGYRMIGIDVGEKEKLSKECGAEVKYPYFSVLIYTF